MLWFNFIFSADQIYLKLEPSVVNFPFIATVNQIPTKYFIFMKKNLKVEKVIHLILN